MESIGRQLYERTLPGRSRGRTLLARLLFIGLYLMVAALLVLLFLFFGAAASLLFLLPLVEGLLLFFTLPYWKKEYEYSFFGETLTISRIYGGKKRKKWVELDLRKASAILPFEEAFRKRVESFGAKRSFYAVPDLAGDHLYLVLFGEGKEKTILCMELDERSLAIVYQRNN